jgi:hypothetical protein
LWFSDSLKIDNQIFAQVTSISNYATCENEQGIVGLANSLVTSHKFPSLLQNLETQQILRSNIFSLYLKADDDYPATQEGSGEFNTIHASQEIKASSQLVLGGVDQSHYIGCLQWHDLVPNQATTTSTTQEFHNSQTEAVVENPTNTYWAVSLDKVRVGGTNLDNSSTGSSLAIVDSGSSYMVGPQAAVSKLVKMNNAKCFVLQQDNPKQVDCSSEDGFDGALLKSCDDPFFNLEFILDGKVYVLEKEDLMVTVETLFGTACILRIVGAQGMEVRSKTTCVTWNSGRRFLVCSNVLT